MAPAGSFESLTAAIQGGADSVYFGVEQLNMRARASINFTIADLKKIVKQCSAHHVKTYLTLNTIVYDHDISVVKKIISEALKAGVNAIIASDQAVISYAFAAGMEVHISTQVNITNVETVKFYSHFATVMVLSRELSLRQMKKINDAIVKEKITGPDGNLVRLEVFAHGALCMAVSGKCYLSLHTQNSSANRGACVQNCRRSYKVVDLEDGHELEIDNEYIMSPKDLCTVDFLDDLIKTGVSVLKIEGRGKSADYVKTVTQCYRQAIDSYNAGTYTKAKAKEWVKEMETVYNRGFWGGYYLGQKLGEWNDVPGSKATVKKVYIGKGNHYYPKMKVAEFKIETYSLAVGDKVMIIGPQTGVVETQIQTLHVNNEGAKQQADKGDLCAFTIDVPIRKADKLYKIVDA